MNSPNIITLPAALSHLVYVGTRPLHCVRPYEVQSDAGPNEYLCNNCKLKHGCNSRSSIVYAKNLDSQAQLFLAPVILLVFDHLVAV